MSPGPNRPTAFSSALRSSGNTKTKIVTLDLAEPVALDMVKGGNVAALVADKAYDIGSAARAAAGCRSARQSDAFLHRRSPSR